MSSIFTRAATVLGCLSMVVALAVSSAVAADKKKDPGKKLYMTKTCIACHGRTGQKAIMDYPNIAGQEPVYMMRQIDYILKGKRTGREDKTGHPRAQGMRGALTVPETGKPTIAKKDLQQIVDWLASQEPAKVTPPKDPLDPASVEAGKELFKKKCKACHGPEGKKPLKGNPYVAGQKRDYLLIQMEDIKSKARKTPKTAGMYAIVKKMDDAQLSSLADYLSQVER